MTDVISDGYIRVTWVPGASGIASIAAPTVAEVNAGLNLTDQVTDDGLIGFKLATAGVKNTSLASTTDTERAGRNKLTGAMLRLKRQMPTDTARSTLTRGSFGFVVIRYSILTGTANTIGQAHEVYPMEVGERAQVDKEDNTMERYEIPLFNHIAGTINAVMA